MSLERGGGLERIAGGGAGITPTSAQVKNNAPSGTIVAKLMTSVSGAVLSVVSGPATKNGNDEIVLNAAAGAADTVQTVRVAATRASPYLKIEQDIPITAMAALADISPLTGGFSVGSSGQFLTFDATDNPVTYTVSPNDGRVVATSTGLAIGLTASSIGTVEYTVTKSKPGYPDVTAVVAVTVSAVSPAPIPAYDLTSTSYGFSKDNPLAATDQKYVAFDASSGATGPTALPVPGAVGTNSGDWWAQFMFRNGDFIDNTVSSADWRPILNQGTSFPNTVTGFTASIRMGGDATYPLGFRVFLANLGGLWWPAADTQQSTTLLNTRRGSAYSAMCGQIGDYPFISLTEIERDGLPYAGTAVTIVSSVPNKVNATSGFYWNGSTVNRYNNTSTFFDLVRGVGSMGPQVADGANRRGYHGEVGNFAMFWGTFPNTGGVPTASVISQIANGTLDPAQLATLAGATYRYGNQLRGPGDLAADTRAVITVPATEGGTAATVQVAARAPIRRTPELTLRQYGNHWVFGLEPGASTGRVRFEGTYAGGTPTNFQVKLTRVDNGATLLDWTDLSGQAIGGGAYSGYVSGIAPGIAFRRSIRWKNQTGLVVNGGDIAAVGIVMLMVGQSQQANQATAGAVSASASGNSLSPTTSTNVWCSLIRIVGTGNAPFSAPGDTTLSPTASHPAFCRITSAGQLGDGDVIAYESIQRHRAMPVMFIDVARPGHHPYALIYDQKPISFAAAYTGFSPDSTSKVFTITSANTEFQSAQAGGTIPFMCKPGTYHLTFSNGWTLVDDGVGGLTATGFSISSASINYKTSVVTFTADIPTGTTITSGGMTFQSDTLFASSGAKTTLGGYSDWGVPGVKGSGLFCDIITRLRNCPVYDVVWDWVTAYQGMGATYPNPRANLVKVNFRDRLLADFPNVFPSTTKMRVMIPQREGISTGTEAVGISQIGNLRQIDRDMIADQATYPWIMSAGDYYDISTIDGSGAHQDGPGALIKGERLGVATAKAYGAAVEFEGPVLTSAIWTDGTLTAIDLSFSFPDAAATAIRAGDAATTGILGIRIGDTLVSMQNAGFTVAQHPTIPTKLRATKTSGAWTENTYVDIAMGIPISNGQGAQVAIDNANLAKLPFDNSNGASKYVTGGRMGNIARAIRAIQVTV